MGEGAGIRPYALLCLLCLILYAPGLAAIPPVDRDEARFAQATRQMLETGDFIRIRFQNEERNKKPIGIYWLQAASVAAFSTPQSAAIWPYRLPSTLAATLAVLLTFQFGARLLASQVAGFAAAVLLGSALGVVVEAHLAKTDAALLAAVVTAQGALGLVYDAARSGRRVSRSLALLFWLAEAAAILLKGPPGPVLALLTAAGLSIADRDLSWIRELRPLVGGLLTVIIVAPWLIAIQSATGGHFISQSLSRDLLPKLVGAQEAHGAPPGYYLVLTLASFWPGSLFIVPALLWGWQRRHVASARFLLAWLIPGWCFLELVPTKLPHYVLPLYPALALLAGSALADGFAGKLFGLTQFLNKAVKVFWAAVTVALAAGLVLLPGRFGDTISPVSIFAGPVLLGLALMLLLHDWRPLQSTVLIAAVAAAFVVPAASFVAPGLDQLWVSRSAAAAVASHSPRAGGSVLAVGYSEPSLVFLLGTATRLAAAAPAYEQLAGASMALVNQRDDAEFLRELTSYRLTAQPLERLTGLDYSAGGGKLVLTLYRLEPG
ncbi:MAG: glycosyltransferase family 39 protein [Stellaceae bacterium]